MGRGPTRPETHLDNLFKTLGLDSNFLASITPEPQAEETQEDSYRRILNSREAEAVLALYGAPDYFKQRACTKCNKRFFVATSSVGYCSDECRSAALEEIGIKWDPTKSPMERWYFEGVPLSVGPQALEAIRNLILSFSKYLSEKDQREIHKDLHNQELGEDTVSSPDTEHKTSDYPPLTS